MRSNSVYGIFATAPGLTVTNSTFLDNGTAIAAASQALIESNHIEIPAGGIGVVAGNFTTIRRNYFGNNSLTGYVTIDLNTVDYVAVVENRMRATLTTGGSGVGLVMPYDVNNALTNFSP